MDNLTHSLIGCVLGDVFCRFRPELNRKTALLTAVVSSNIADLDFLSVMWNGSDALLYLLAHRGYTHTIFFAPLLAAVAAGLGGWLGREKSLWQWSLFFLALLGVLLHILADFCNHYGVHPFSPLWNDWVYGDTLFIIEPLLLFSLLAYVFSAFRNRAARIFSLACTALLLYGVAGNAVVPQPVAIGLSVGAVGFFLLQLRVGTLTPVMLALMVVLSVFALASRYVKKQLLSELDAYSSEELLQLAISPAPGNPLCWSITMASLSEGQTYIARAGVLSLAPSFLLPQECFPRWGFSHATQLATQVQWSEEFRKPLQEYRELLQHNCVFRAFSRFSRIPIWYTNASGVLVAEDLRFTQGGRGGFSQIDLRTDGVCVDNDYPWNPPVALQAGTTAMQIGHE